MAEKKFIGQLRGKELFEAEKKLSEYEGDDRMVSSIDLAEQLKETEDSSFIIPTGVKSLDEMHEGGIEAGEVWLFSGPSGEGKTTLTMSITQNMARKGFKTAWFTLEVTPRQFIKKMTARSDELPLFYLPNENQDPVVEWIEERIVEAKVKFDCKVVFIDHLQQIFSMAVMQKNSNLSWEIGDLMAKIKNIAVMHDIAICLIAHTKDDPSGSSREPRKEDIRDSGLVQRLADTIVMVWRVPNDDDLKNTRRKVLEKDDIKAKVRVVKNRRVGTPGSFFMFHDKHYLKEEGNAYSTDPDDF
jgi:replicative DNA helicase